MRIEEIRITLILLAVVFGLSVSLLAGKALLHKAPVPDEPVAVSPAVPAAPAASDTPAVPAASDASATSAPTSGETDAQSVPVSPDPVELAPPTVTPATTVKPAVTTVKPAATSVKPAATSMKPAATSVKPAATSVKPAATSVSRTASRTATVKPATPKKGYLIFVFDDAGHNLEQLDPFLALPFPCTIAVLPGLQYSGEAARKIRAAGKAVILHQPMQALNRSMDPGPGAITAGMSPGQIKAIVRGNLAEVGPVVGLNNHEGSLITADRSAMEAVLDVVREKGIYFLDSRTNADTMAPIVARERNMTIWERSVFLDNSQDKADIIEAVAGGMKIAEKKGSAIMIGHIWSNDLANVLTSMYPELVSQGFSLSTIADIATDRDFDE